MQLIQHHNLTNRRPAAALRADRGCLHRDDVHRAGVTLIDMLITVMIIGIMAAVAVPKFTSFYQTERLDAAARRVVADLNLVKSWAATTSSAQTVSFVPPSGNYSVAGGLMDPRHPTELYAINLDSAPYYSSISSVNFDGETFVSFNGAGLPNSGGEIVVTNGTQSLIILVNSVTGKATVQ